ncbi:phage holin, lambda family [Buttiauxella agrestis]|uniref:Phage holin, lambda family n=1 Tax=Buttiauxella agrestis TaxID=82977 RepID=A0A381C601_9ENTR|nr:phage holin family protein [Buttiauxella agrestis]SUW63281.1 phage holin, lambda family [Buttiauxella agrestis]
MLEKEPGLLGWLSATGAWLLSHPYASWGSLTAFLAALWSALKDGKGWCASTFAGVLAIAITLSVLAVMRKTGLHEEWMPLVGMLVGFIGADRIRAAVVGAWDSRKIHLKGDDKNG